MINGLFKPSNEKQKNAFFPEGICILREVFINTKEWVEDTKVELAAAEVVPDFL